MKTTMKWNNNFWILGAVLAFMLVVAAVLFPNLPDDLPIHYNINGEPDNWMPKALAIWIMPAIATLVWSLMTAFPYIDPKRERYEKFSQSYTRLKVGVLVFLSGLQVLLLTGYEEPQLLTRMILFGAALLFVYMGNEMGRFEQTWFSGIRTPWTLADERVWRRTHRVGARWFVGIGALNMVAAPLLPIPIVTLVFLVTVIGVSLGITAYSYVIYQRLNG